MEHFFKKYSHVFLVLLQRIMQKQTSTYNSCLSWSGEAIVAAVEGLEIIMWT
jgi:hypothetical protein